MFSLKKQLAAWISNTCAQNVYPSTKTLPTGTIAAKVQGITVALQPVAGVNQNTLTFGEFRASMTMSHDAVSVDPYIKCKDNVVSFSGTIALGQLVTIGNEVFGFHTTPASLGTGVYQVSVSSSANATVVAAALLAKINSASTRGLVASALTSSAVLIKALEKVRVTTDATNGSVAHAPLMSDGAAQVDLVLPAGAYHATEEIEITVASISAPDGRTIPGAVATLTVG